jgi:ABC-type branched-subunit amino acid transport system ATPase component
MNLLEVRKVQSGYGKLPVLHGVSIDVDEGEMVAVLGANGAGKTTLMNTIFRVLPLMAGSINFMGRPIGGLRADQVAHIGMGYVPQGKNVFADLTVQENLEMGGYLLKEPGSKVAEMLQRFPILAERRKQRAGTLSGGERQLLAIACALITDPKLLILDEPTTGLSPVARDVVIKTIQDINHDGMSILVVIEENPKRLLPLIERVYLMAGGLIVKEGKGASFLDEEGIEEFFLGGRQAIKTTA